MSLYTILQILSVTLFEKSTLFQILTAPRYTNINQTLDNQLKLFESGASHICVGDHNMWYTPINLGSIVCYPVTC